MTTNEETVNTNAAALLKAYIKTMAQSTLTEHCESNPMVIDAVIGGGAFNGAYAFGVMLYLLELVDQKKIIIKRASGCSIGSLVALCIICNQNVLTFSKMWVDTKNGFRDNQRLEIETITREIIDACLKDKDISTLTNKLFITMTDLKGGEHIIKSEWQTKEELHEDLIKSCFLPYIMDGNSRFKEQWVDGIIPYLFKDPDSKCIYIDLYSLHKNRWIKCLFTKSEKNPDQRVLEGVNECCQFLNGEKSYLCSWVHNWHATSFLSFRLHFLFVYTLIIIAEFINRFDMPDLVKNNILYKGVVNTLMKLVQDSFYLGQY